MAHTARFSAKGLRLAEKWRPLIHKIARRGELDLALEGIEMSPEEARELLEERTP